MCKVLGLRKVRPRHPSHKNRILCSSQIVLCRGNTGGLHKHCSITVDELIHPRLLTGDHNAAPRSFHPNLVTPHVLTRRAAIHSSSPVLHSATGVIVHDGSNTVGGSQLVAHRLQHINPRICSERDLASIRMRCCGLRGHDVVILAILTTGPVRLHIRVVHVRTDHYAQNKTDDEQDSEWILPTGPNVGKHNSDSSYQRSPNEDRCMVVQQQPHQGKQPEHQPRDQRQENHRRVALVGGRPPLGRGSTPMLRVGRYFGAHAATRVGGGGRGRVRPPTAGRSTFWAPGR
mmetsp:Transcript_36909/g.80693  ORF Transcript_36909/g.80693 Transcript_36909/m.80693 type:complete len:288 (+) Transcript_36909:153-1016(+)